MEREVVRRFEELERRMDAVEERVGMATLERPAPVPPSVRALRALARPGPKLQAKPEAKPQPMPEPVSGPESLAGFAPPPLLDEVSAKPVPAKPVRALAQKPVPVTAVSSTTEHADWEGVLGVAVLGRIGVGAVLLAAGYFAQLAYRGMSDAAKVYALYGLSVLMLGVGAWVRDRVSRTYVGLLWGGGVAVSYMAGVAGHLIYDIFRPEVAFVLLVLACVLGQLLARRLRSETLAVVSLAGAFAVPFLVDVQTDHRTFMLIYVLLLHSWSALCERRWDWKFARTVGVLGLWLVGGTWIAKFGGADISTLVHVQCYLLGLLAPEILGAWQRRPIDLERTLCAGLCVALVPVGVALAFAHLGPLFRNLFVPSLLWMAIAVVLSLRDRKSALGQSLGLWAGFLLVFSGAFVAIAVPAGWDAPTWSARAPALVFSAMAFGLLALRALLRSGEAASTAAATFGALAALFSSRGPAELYLLSAAPLAAFAALVWRGREPATRADAHGLGLLLLLGVGIRMASDDIVWHPIGPALAAVWSALWLLVPANRTKRAFVLSSQVLWALIGVVWLFQAFEGPSTHGALFHPATLAGVVVAGAAAFTARRFGGLLREWFAGIAVVVGVSIGYREAALVPTTLSAGEPGLYWVVGYFLAFAGTLAAASRRRWPSGRIWGAAVLAVAAAHAVSHASSVEAVAVAVGVLGMAWLLERTDEVARALAGLAGALAIVAWGWTGIEASLAQGPSMRPFLNATFFSGVPVLAALCLAAFKSPARARPQERVTAALVLTAFAYVLGLHETVLIVRDLGDAWPRIGVSLYSILFAAALLTIGFVQHLRGVRLLAIGMFFAIVAKIGLFDLAFSKLPLRILVTGVLGFVLLAASYAYARHEAKHRSAT